uniref:tRNA-5-taurinomethyluridine 2-sulfurtransferase n=1 Tax=Syphacia muris TaxID=451379 RepID=A0A0N5A7Z7_9BILA
MGLGIIRRVACAVSGGVDSAVAAYLLKRRGFDVVGIYMVSIIGNFQEVFRVSCNINWDDVEEGRSTCPRTKDESDAAEVCRHLDIQFCTVNFVREYWNNIFTYLLDNYTRGRTVVPDVLCNKIVKFDLLHQYAFEKLGVDAVATGHYVRTTWGEYLEKRDDHSAVKLLCGTDPLKDQSYFLCGLTQSQLKRSMFPIGKLTKTDVRSIANELNLKVANKPESMGICFIGKRKNFSEFLDQYLEKHPGTIKLIGSGEVLGYHDGIHHFNIGKHIRSGPKFPQSSLRFYVADLDSVTNTVWACKGVNHPSLFATEFIIKEPLWIANSPFNDSDNAVVNFRCQRTHPAFRCHLSRIEKGVLSVVPDNPVRAAAPGQMCVLYRYDECLGGSEILKIKRTLFL